MEESGFLRIVINNVNAFHDELHDLRASENGSRPAQERPFPGLGTALDQEFGNNLTAAGRQVLGEIGDEVEQIGVAAQAAGSNRDSQQERGKEGQEKIEGDGLRDHSATRKDARENSQNVLRKAGRRNHGLTSINKERPVKAQE